MRWTVAHFREAMPGPHKREGRSGFRSPCPVHGGTDRAWVRRGRREVVGGCNSGCTLPDMAQAVGLLTERGHAAPQMHRGRVRPASPEERAQRNAGYPDPPQRDPAGLAERLVHSPVLTDPMALAELDVWAQERDLSSDRLLESGWRGIDGPGRWRLLGDLPAAYGWTPGRDSGRPLWPRGIDRGPALLMPYRDSQGRLAGVRFRRRASGQKEDKLSMPGDTVRLYGADVLPMASPGAVIHIAEGESDTESLREHGVIAVGTPGNQTWKPEWTRATLRAEPGRVVLWPDPGASGLPFVKKIWGALSRFGVRVRVMRPDTNGRRDVSELHVDGELASIILKAER